MASGLKEIKRELGPDALILSTRTIGGGPLRKNGKSRLEITAAIDQEHHADKKLPSLTKLHSLGKKGSLANWKKSSITEKKGFSYVVDDPIETKPQEISLAAQPSPTLPGTPQDRVVSRKEFQLENEMTELKAMVNDLSGQLSRLMLSSGSLHYERGNGGYAPDRTSADLESLTDDLCLRGIKKDIAATISRHVRERLGPDSQKNPEAIQQELVGIIGGLVEVCPPDFSRKGMQHRAAFVGPTGVGKTTTLAKLCASYLREHSANIALITIDTYRIAAVEQLKVYGEIMQLPVDVVITPEQLQEALDRHQDKDLVLIDTAGRSPLDDFRINELADFLRPELGIDNHLVLSAALRETELLRAIEHFSKLNLYSTIFTKIDECHDLGAILNVQLQNPYPLSWMTNGQRVPEDLLTITPASVAQLIVGEHKGIKHD